MATKVGTVATADRKNAGSRSSSHVFTLQEARECTALHTLTTDKIVKVITNLEEQGLLVDAHFITQVLDCEEFSAPSSESSHDQRRELASRLAVLLQSEDGAIPILDLCVTLSMFSCDNPTTRLALNLGMYGSLGADRVPRMHVFHFLQQVCRFLVALAPLPEDYADRVQLTALEMMKDVFAHEDEQPDSVTFEVLARWWLASELDGGYVAQPAPAQEDTNVIDVAGSNSATAKTDFDAVRVVFQHLLNQAQASTITNDTLANTLPISRKDLDAALRLLEGSVDDSILGGCTELFQRVFDQLLAAPSKTSEDGALSTIASSTNTIDFEHLFVGIQFVIGGADSRRGDVKSQASLAFRVYAQVGVNVNMLRQSAWHSDTILC